MSSKSSLKSQKVLLLSHDSLGGTTNAANAHTTQNDHPKADVELHKLDHPSITDDIDSGDLDHSESQSQSQSIEFLSPFDEFKTILRITLLVTGSLLFEFGPQIIGNILVGHYYDNQMKDDEYLSAIGLSNTFNFIGGIVIVWGMHTGLYTLVPQAVGIADKSNRDLTLKIYFQRALVVCALVSIPCLILQYFAGDILVAIGEPGDLKQKIHYYSLVIAPFILALTFISILQRIFQPLDYNTLLTSVNAFGCAITYPVMYFFVDTCKLGFLGVGIGQTLVSCIQGSVVVITTIYKGFGDLYKPMKYDIILNGKEMKEYVRLSMPGLVQNGFEWTIIQLATMLSGFVGKNNEHTTSISSSVIMYNLYLILISFGYGMANGVNISVAKYIASGQGNKSLEYAKRSAKIGYFICVGIGCLLAILLASCGDFIPHIWTHNKDTVALARQTVYAMAFWSFFLMHNQYLAGLYRALAFQKVSARFSVGTYYGMYLPLIIILLFAAS